MSEASKFTENILTAAKEKAESIISEAEDETKRALEEAKAHTSREAEEILRNARLEAENVRRRRMSEVRHRNTLQEQVEKSKIMSDVLDLTKHRVMEIVEDERKYLPYLVNLVENGIRELGLDAVLIQLSDKDMKRIDRGKMEAEIMKKLGGNTKIEWAKKPVDAMGGAIISSNDGRSRIVNTLDQRFEALEPKLLIEAGKLLFGE